MAGRPVDRTALVKPHLIVTHTYKGQGHKAAEKYEADIWAQQEQLRLKQVGGTAKTRAALWGRAYLVVSHTDEGLDQEIAVQQHQAAHQLCGRAPSKCP